MYRIERGNEVSPGQWAYTVDGTPLSGVSRQPLLDACRQLKSLYGSTADRAGVFRAGHEEADISGPVMAGAHLTVDEGGRVPRFAKWKLFGGGIFPDAPTPPVCNSTHPLTMVSA